MGHFVANSIFILGGYGLKRENANGAFAKTAFAKTQLVLRHIAL